jgi:aminoglycoside phosphotransferase (APT) family kinase protein
MDDITLCLAPIMRRAVGGEGAIENLARLSGGANMESSSFDWAGQGYVLRRAPSAAMMEGRAFGHDIEAAIVRAAHRAGVLAPEIVGELEPEDRIGTGYIMRRVDGEVRPDKILAAPPTALINDIARELALIHTIAPDPTLPSTPTAAMVAALKERFISYGGDRPIMALTLAWLDTHIPPPAPPVFLHGDFRMGNLMVGPHGLAAVLDWELAHIGDAHEDLVWGCVNSWRFGHIDKPAFGISDLAPYWAAYEAHSGTAVDPARFRFWLIFRTLWWGLCCLQMADIWRAGLDPSLERAVIGRRASEAEMDLLQLLESDAPAAEARAIAAEPQSEPRRQGEPSHVELLEAISQWITQDVKPKAQGRDRFSASVALNALGMLIREAASPASEHDRALCDDILAGRKTLATPGLLSTLRRNAIGKLAIDQPKYSALAQARTMWL